MKNTLKSSKVYYKRARIKNILSTIAIGGAATFVAVTIAAGIASMVYSLRSTKMVETYAATEDFAKQQKEYVETIEDPMEFIEGIEYVDSNEFKVNALKSSEDQAAISEYDKAHKGEKDWLIACAAAAGAGLAMALSGGALEHSKSKDESNANSAEYQEWLDEEERKMKYMEN